MVEKVVSLERAKGTDDKPGSFGFSILGGAGTKLPAVVCEVDPQGPADLTEKVRVGDQLLKLNGEVLAGFTPKELVQTIRTAPSPSIFVLVEDEELHRQVVSLLRKQERKARQRSGAVSSADLKAREVRVRDHRKVSAPTLSNASVSGDERRKRGRQEKIIEVEPSVNINEGRGGDIVQVLDNRIIGIIDQSEERPKGKEQSCDQRRSPQPQHHVHGSMAQPSPTQHHTSPPSPSQQYMSKSSITSEATSPSGSLSPLSASSRSPKISHGSAGSLDQKAVFPSHQGYTTTVKSNSMDSFTPIAGTSAGSSTLMVMPELNGETRSYSDSSGLNSISENSYDDDKMRAKKGSNQESAITEAKIGDEVKTSTEHHHVSGLAVHVPSWSGPMQRKPRASLAEELLVGELHPSGQSTPTSSPDTPTKERTKYQMKPSDSREELMRKYRISRSPSKRRQDPHADAITTARRLYMLDGYKKSEVAQHLASMSEHGQTVAREYLKFFEFEGMTLDTALRQFLSFFSLIGESQERERIMVHFSERYFVCNPDMFPSQDIVHGLTIAMLLLNTDMHVNHGRQKMTYSQFVSNLQQIEVRLPKDLLKRIYDGIKRQPLEWALDDEEGDAPPSTSHPSTSHSTGCNHTATEELEDDTARTYHVTIPGTFVEVEMPGNALLFKEGFVMRKNIMEGPHKKVPRGKRQWKPYYAHLKGFLLYFAPPNGELHLDDTSSAVTICHCLAMRAADYHKKASVVRVTTSDWHAFLLQTANVTDMQQWIGAINKAAALYSSPPLAAPVSSSSHFQKPTFPLAPTKNNEEQQIECHESKIKSLDKELEEHQAYKPKGSKSKHGQLQDWFDKFEFLQFEINRFRIYLASITSDVIVDYNAPLPSGLVPSPSISTLATPGPGDDGELLDLGVTPFRSPLTHTLANQKHTGTPKGGKHS